LLSIAEVGTVSHVEKTVRLYRKSERAAELQAESGRYAERSLSCHFYEDGSFVIKGRLAPEQGALVMKALQAAADALREAERDSREAAAGAGRDHERQDASREALAGAGHGDCQRDASREASVVTDAPREAAAARRADALVLMAETLLGRGAVPLAAGDRHLVTVHIDEQVLRDQIADGRCELEGGPALPPATVRRLCCDGGLVSSVTVGCR
jgi:hypothetical protein